MGRLGMTAEEIAKQERLMLRQAREVGADNAQHLGDWEILARLRHHGAATRLIDFTTDPLVALWFLCEDNSVLAGSGSVRNEAAFSWDCRGMCSAASIDLICEIMATH